MNPPAMKARLYPGEDGQYGTKDDIHYIAYHENVGLRDRNLAHIEDIIAQSRQTEGNWQTASQTAVDAHEQDFKSQQEDRQKKVRLQTTGQEGPADDGRSPQLPRPGWGDSSLA